MNFLKKMFGSNKKTTTVYLNDILKYESLYKEGIKCAASKDFTTAMAHFRAMLKMQPEGAVAYECIGMVHNEQQHYAEAIDAFKKVIELKPDRASSYTHLGNIYFKQGKQQEGIKMWKKAAELGDGNAQTNLNKYETAKEEQENDTAKAMMLYDMGLMSAQSGNHEQAMTFWKESAELGLKEAQYNLGVMYNKGRGVSMNFKEAAYWYQQAADQGDADAIGNLGILYFTGGLGLEQDLSKSKALLEEASDKGNVNAERFFEERF